MYKTPEIMSLKDAAHFLKQSEEQLSTLYNSGELPGVQLGETYCFKSEDLLKLSDNIVKDDACSDNSMGIQVKEVLKPENIIFRVASNKSRILNELIDIIGEMPESGNVEALRQGIFNREALMSTGMGLGVAIPHVRLNSIRNIAMAVAVVRDGVYDYETFDQTPVKLIFMITARPEQHPEHLKIVSQLSLRLKDRDIRDKLLNSEGVEEFQNIMYLKRRA